MWSVCAGVRGMTSLWFTMGREPGPHTRVRHRFSAPCDSPPSTLDPRPSPLNRPSTLDPAVMKLTFLGTGTSFGVPQLGCHCAVCRSPDPRDRRTRVGALVESNRGTRVLIDTPPELRMQLVAAGIDRVDAVLFTHDHADHTHGIDDLRAITVRLSAPLPFYGSADTIANLSHKFGYILDENVRPLPGTYKPEGRAHIIRAGEAFSIGDTRVMPVCVPHGPASVFG